MNPPQSVTLMIQQLGQGSDSARNALFEAAYPELRKLARARLRGGGRGRYLQTTSLVSESFLRFKDTGKLRMEHSGAFFAYASRVMESIICDSVRQDSAGRRDAVEVTLNTACEDSEEPEAALALKVAELLEVLEKADPRLAEVVRMHFFAGFSFLEIAEVLDLNERTVRRDWERARAMLAILVKD